MKKLYQQVFCRYVLISAKKHLAPKQRLIEVCASGSARTCLYSQDRCLRPPTSIMPGVRPDSSY